MTVDPNDASKIYITVSVQAFSMDSRRKCDHSRGYRCASPDCALTNVETEARLGTICRARYVVHIRYGKAVISSRGHRVPVPPGTVASALRRMEQLRAHACQ